MFLSEKAQPTTKVSWEDVSVLRTFVQVKPIHPNDIPLALTIKEVQKLAKVMDKASDLHPFGLTITSDCLRCLKKMVNLR